MPLHSTVTDLKMVITSMENAGCVRSTAGSILRLRLDELQVVDSAPSQSDKVYFGAWVVLEDDDGEERRFRLVGLRRV